MRCEICLTNEIYTVYLGQVLCRRCEFEERQFSYYLEQKELEDEDE